VREKQNVYEVFFPLFIFYFESPLDGNFILLKVSLKFDSSHFGI